MHLLAFWLKKRPHPATRMPAGQAGAVRYNPISTRMWFSV